MALRRIAILVILLSFAISNCLAQTEGPLGLIWGQSSGDVRASGVELKDFPSQDFGKSFIASALPRALADQENALLSFGHNDKLWRIVVFGRPNDHDPMGGSAKTRYDELRQNS